MAVSAKKTTPKKQEIPIRVMDAACANSSDPLMAPLTGYTTKLLVAKQNEAGEWVAVENKCASPVSSEIYVRVDIKLDQTVDPALAANIVQIKHNGLSTRIELPDSADKPLKVATTTTANVSPDNGQLEAAKKQANAVMDALEGGVKQSEMMTLIAANEGAQKWSGVRDKANRSVRSRTSEANSPTGP